MKPYFNDGEARQILNERKTMRDNEWLRGVIGDATYLLSLQILGYCPNDAKTELRHLEMDKRQCSRQQ